MTQPATNEEAPGDLPAGETLAIPERVIVAPTWGTFEGGQMIGGDLIGRGDVIGTVKSRDASTPIHSPFKGLLVTLLAHEGERVRPGQAVAWLRVS